MDISKEFSSINVAIEDISAYAMRISTDVIDTCKMIGEFTYRFNTSPRVNNLMLVPRTQVKKWVFDTFPEVAMARIEKKMISSHKRRLLQGEKGLLTADGLMKKPSFVYVDDRIVIAAMKVNFGIPTPKPGKPNVHGLVKHSWQALAVCGYIHRSGGQI